MYAIRSYYASATAAASSAVCPMNSRSSTAPAIAPIAMPSVHLAMRGAGAGESANSYNFV